MSALVVLAYAGRFRRRQRVDEARKLEAAQLGIDKPTAQFPWIDPTRCIGCGACVAACPEGDVLGVVGGTAVVVNGMRCVGHARCEAACPVGAIEVGLGDVRGRADMPLLDEWNESTGPGLFLAGEVGGLALVKNAIAQGQRAVERIHSRRAAPAADGVRDLLIVGAGPAGLSAALAASERGLDFTLLEQESDLGGSLLHYPRRKMVLLQPVDLPGHGRLVRPEYQKEELVALFENLVRSRSLDVRFGAKVTAVRRGDDGVFEVTGEGIVERAHAIVLAVGRRGTPRRLGVPGEELAKVMYRLLDAESYRGQRVLVVGGGDSSVEAAVGLARQEGNDVTLSYRRDRLVRIKKKNEDRLRPLVTAGRIRTAFGSQVVHIGPTEVVLRTAGVEQVLPNDWVFVFAGGEPPFALLRAAGVRFGDDPTGEGLEHPRLS